MSDTLKAIQFGGPWFYPVISGDVVNLYISEHNALNDIDPRPVRKSDLSDEDRHAAYVNWIKLYRPGAKSPAVSSPMAAWANRFLAGVAKAQTGALR